MWIFQFSSWQLDAAYLGILLRTFLSSAIHKSISPSFAEQKLSQFHTVNRRMEYDLEKFVTILT